MEHGTQPLVMAKYYLLGSLTHWISTKLVESFGFMRQAWALHKLENLQVSPNWDMIESPLLSRRRGETFSQDKQNKGRPLLHSRRPRSWTRLEVDTLISLYRHRPLWSYWDIAIQLMYLDQASSAPVSRDAPWSPEDCARRLHALYALIPERFGTALPPPLSHSSNAVHTLGGPDTDPIVTNFQPTLCNECVALDLGRAHEQALLDFDDWWAGPDTKDHPASQSVRALEESAELCSCCSFMYKAITSTSTYKLLRPRLMQFVSGDLPTKLAFTRASGEHYVVIKAATTPSQEIVRLRMAHLDDWLPFRCFPDDRLPPTPYCTFAHLVPEAPELPDIAAWIRQQLTECQIRHHRCPKFHSVEAPLPIRVLLIQEEDERIIIRLIDGPQQNDPYVALSYVWGDSGQFSLTTETEQSLRTGIDVAELAKTTREAAELTHALGLKYLWIDALCIKQDSVSDWEEQSSQMTQIYSNSELTLIAARSSGVETGFFRPTAACVAYCGSVQYQGTRKPVFLTQDRDSASVMAPDPLALRAWTLQEEYLSKRKVKFTGRQMEWHCPSGQVEEQERDMSYNHPSTQSSFLHFAGEDLFRWKNVARDYSARQLTVQSDRLPGLSGLASLYAAQSGREYLAGLWSGPYLFDLLLWFRTTESPESTVTRDGPGYLAPSWSWIAVNAPINFKNWIGLETTHDHISKVVNCTAVLKGSNPFGEVVDGHLDLSAPAVITTVATILAVNEHLPHIKSRKDNSLLLQHLLPEHIMEPAFADWTWPNFWLDCNDYSDDLVAYCVVLGHEWWGEDDYGMYGILVTPVSLPHRTFRRIGMFHLLPKFRQSDHDLSMQELLARQDVKARDFLEKDLKVQIKAQENLMSATISKHGRDVDPGDKYARQEVTDLLNESKNRAQTMKRDVDFHNFRII